MRWKVITAFLFLFGLHYTTRASCGSASCPINSYHSQDPGSLQLSFVNEYINQDQIYVGSTRAFVGAIPEEDDEVRTVNSRSVIGIHYGLLDRLSIGLDIPFIHREHSHIHHDEGQAVWESWDFNGLGDLVVSTRWTILAPSSPFDADLSLLAGLKIPTGVTRATNAGGGVAEVGIQPGSGSRDGIVGVNLQQSLFSLPMFSGEYAVLPLVVDVVYQFNGKGTDGWRFGNALVASIGTEYRLIDQASVLLQFNGRFQAYADVGSTGEPRENTGGTWIFISPGVRVQLSDAFSAYSYVQLPMYQDVHGVQQTSKFNLQFGVTATVGLLD